MSLVYQHKELAEGRWFTFSLVEQMANVGSDVLRALKWRQKGNTVYADHALERALELLSLTIDDSKNKLGLRELTRTHEMLVDYFWGDNTFHVQPDQLTRYFNAFAYAARNRVD